MEKTRTKIFIPEKMKVGFRNSDQNDKEAFLTYYDEKKKLRQRTSLSSFRHNQDDVENVPTSGLKIEDCSGGWGTCRDYLKIEDPRGFITELSVPNTVFLINNGTIQNGELLGDYVYGWEAGFRVVVPVGSKTYEYCSVFSQNKNKKIKQNDLFFGAKCITKTGGKFIYLGQFLKHKFMCREGDIKNLNPKQTHIFVDLEAVEASWRNGKIDSNCISQPASLGNFCLVSDDDPHPKAQEYKDYYLSKSRTLHAVKKIEFVDLPNREGSHISMIEEAGKVIFDITTFNRMRTIRISLELKNGVIVYSEDNQPTSKVFNSNDDCLVATLDNGDRYVLTSFSHNWRDFSYSWEKI